MKPAKPPVSRKVSALSVEEELAELLADPTLKPSLSFLGIQETTANKIANRFSSGTERVSATVSVPDTDIEVYQVKPPIEVTNKDGHNRIIESVPDTDSIPDTGSLSYHRPAPKKANLVEEGHSHAEHSVYEALWRRSKPYRQDTRVITIGFGAMSRIVRLSLNNCRQNIRSLIRKLAIEEMQAEQCGQKIGKTYLIYSPQATLHRRRSAGLEWVVRTKGVAFVNPLTGAVLTAKSSDSLAFQTESAPHTDPIPVLNQYPKS
jgi:hypothetical protein